MKLVFCIDTTLNSGGMERVLSQRVNYLIEKFEYDITIITTENNSIEFKNKTSFFYFNPKIEIIDLSIKYCDVQWDRSKKNFFINKLKSKK